MKQTILVLGGILVFLAIGYALFFHKQSFRNVPPKNDTIAVFGDSLVEGVGSTPGNDFPSVVARMTGKKVYNFGHAGDTTAQALVRIGEVLEVHAGTVVVVLGGNDFLKKVDRTETFATLERIVTTLQDSGSAVIVVGVQSGVLGDGAGKEYQHLAEQTQSLYVPNILDGLFGNTKYMSDAVHPNDAGYIKVAERIVEAINQLRGK